MASTSSSTSHPADDTTRYQVFLSFRGEDTRNNFTDHLYKALIDAGVLTFRDNEEIERGQELKPEIETAIVRSRASIVVLSENYADSRWCLNELWLILQRRNYGHFVLPVFYHVDPSDVRNQRGSFAIEGSKGTVEDVRRWKAALAEVANLSGMVVSGPETDFITKVVNTILDKLDLRLLSIPTHLIGVETQLQAINSWLNNEQVNAIAICGMGGSGKTTLAQCIYNLNKQDFECSSFVEEVGKHYKHCMLDLQKRLLKDLGNLRRKEREISGVYEGTTKIVEVLKKKKVLLVLDDIDDQDELSKLLGENAFSTKSKVIITTRLLDIDAWFVSISWSCRVHTPKFLSHHESLELLSWHAFRSKIPIEGFEELATQLAQYCDGNPLALKVLGSSLLVSDEDPNKRSNMVEIWRERMNSLSSLNGNLNSKIHDVLRKSFDCLPDSHKELFLDIACFFVDEREDMETIMRDGIFSKYGINTLIKRCLCTVSPDTGELMMHQLLRDMGRKITCEESKNPVKRSRVWNDDESYCLLRKGDDSNTIESLVLDMRKVEKRMGSEAIKTSSIAKMHKLKLLRLKCVKLTGSYEHFPELRWLYWYECPLKKMPTGLLKTSLVAMDMSRGRIKKFEAPTVLNSLKYLSLDGCRKLVSICNFHRLPKLETLILAGCYSLTHLCGSIGYLENLAHLDLSACLNLWKHSSSKMYLNNPERLKAICIGGGTPEQPSFSLPNSLMVLAPNYCRLGYKYNSCVHVVFLAQRVSKLCLWGNPYKYLPNYIDFKMLRILRLDHCHYLESLLCLPSTLVELKIEFCTSLKRITFQSGCSSLQTFEYKFCLELCEVQGLFKLVPVDKADLGHMHWIKAYKNHKVVLVGDEIAIFNNYMFQMLYEYGITSTYLQGIEYKRLMECTYMSSSAALSFSVNLSQKKSNILGLYVGCRYRSLVPGYRNEWRLLAKISIINKGVTWVYNPAVYGSPSVDKDVLWLSYWPIGSILKDGDDVHLEIIVEEGVMMVSECSASLVYNRDDKVVEEEENNKSNTMFKQEEVIGGDLSEFEVTTGGYYLCRRDLFKSNTSNWLKRLFGENILYTESEGWRKARDRRWMSNTKDFDLERELVQSHTLLTDFLND